MGYHRIHKSSSWNQPSQAKSAQLAPRPFASQATQKSQTPPTHEAIENEAFDPYEFEAFGRQLQEKSGPITPVAQERLGVFPTKMKSSSKQELKRTSLINHNFANISVYPPDRQVSGLGQPSKPDAQQQLPKPLLEPATNRGMGWVPRALSVTSVPTSHPMHPFRVKLNIGQSIAQRTVENSPIVPLIYIVQSGNTPRSIAEAHHVALEALLEVNRDKLQKWNLKDGRTVEGFNAGEAIIIPAAPATNEKATGQEQTWNEWAVEKAQTVADTIAGVSNTVSAAASELWDDVVDWWDDQKENVSTDGREASAPKQSGNLPAERVQYWVDLATSCSKEKRHAGQSNQPLKVEQIDALLVELAKDMKTTVDPVQLRVLASVQFQFETTKRGTTYNFGSERDYNIEGTFDCSEAVQWIMQKAGLGDIFGESTETVATVYMTEIIENVFGSRFRKQPRSGDLMMWVGHVGLVAAVRPEQGVFLVSHMAGGGSYFNAFDLADPTKVDPSRSLLGSGQWGSKPSTLKGYWAPEDASLPSPIGKATIIEKGWSAHKYYLPNDKANLGSKYSDGEQVDLLKQEEAMWLVQRTGSRGAAWVRAKNISVTK